jgi:acetoacetate decarboxylase
VPFVLDRRDLVRLRRLHFQPEFTNAEMLMAVYRTDPEVVARLLPKPLTPAAEPLVFAFVARYPQTNFGSIYNEGALFVTARFRDRTGGYCLAMPVDDDTALIGGREYFGFPKKMAEEIRLQRRGHTIAGQVVRKGVEILRIELEPDADAALGDFAALAPPQIDRAGHPCLQLDSYLFKFFPSADGRKFDYLPRLIRQTTVFRPHPGLRRGTGRVMVASSERDPLGELPVIGDPLLCVHGYWDNTMLPGRVVARIWNLWRFLPYAFFKSDLEAAALHAAGEKRTLRRHAA